MAEIAKQELVEKPELTSSQVQKLGQQLNEPEALTSKRRTALNWYHKHAIPDRVGHLWRYSDPGEYLPHNAPLPGGPVLAHVPLADNAVTVWLQPGVAPRISVADNARRAGIEVENLTDSDRAAQYLGSVVGPEQGLLEALNFATFAGGVLLRVPAGVALAAPLRVVINAPQAPCSSRLLVVLEAGASATVIEEHRGGGEHNVGNHVTELLAGADSRLRHIVLQNWRGHTTGHINSRCRVDRGALYQSWWAMLGGHRVKANIGASLAENGSRSEISGAVVAKTEQRFDLHTEHEHTAAHSTSQFDFKAVAGDRAQSTYTGLIRIEEQAVGCEAFQENRNLLLSQQARAETIPELEILTDDVSCSHGATVSSIDKEQLFYLQSRGISRSESIRLIVHSFLEQVFFGLEEPLLDEVTALLEQQMEQVRGEI